MSNSDSSCIFCKIVKQEISCNKLLEDDKHIAFRDINPQAPVHVLIIPKEHIANITLATDPKILGLMFQKASALAKQEGLDNGFRLVVNTGGDGGQTVDHLHLHILGGRSLKWPPG